MSRVRLFGLSALIAPGIRIIKIVSSTIKFPTVATKKQPLVSIHEINMPPREGLKSIDPLKTI